MFLNTPDSNFLNAKLAEIQSNFSKIEAVFECMMPKLCRDIDELKQFTKYRHSSKHYRIANANLVKKCFEYMSNGISYNDALVMAANECNDTIERAELVCEKEKMRKKTLERYAKIYMIKTLLNNGLKNIEIAKITGFTPEYISYIKNGKKKVHFSNIDLS